MIHPRILARVIELATPLVAAPLRGRIAADAALDDLRLDQLDALTIAMAAEEHWNLPELPEADRLRWHTLRDIAATIEHALERAERTAA